jgi:predicted O-linked N-acetylglucosamine transferase (SPINDLY family)
VIYFCGQSLFKFTKDYLQYIVEIMQDNPNAVLLMLNGDIKKEFIKSMDSDVINRIHWFPGLQHHEYLNLIKISDVILDTYPFGGCNSSLEAFALGKVMVTLPSDMCNGRFTKGFYDKMGLSQYVQHSREQYIDFAKKLANKEYREAIELEILSKKDVLFDEVKSVEDWGNKIIELLDKI